MQTRGLVLMVVSVAAAAVLTDRATAARHGSVQEAAAPVLTFTSDAALVTMLIKPDKTADFEMVLGKLREALQKSDKTERQQQAAGWTIYKASQPIQGSVAYIMRIEPVLQGQEYDISRLIAEVFPVEVQEIFPKYRDAFAGRAIAELTPFMSMR